MVNFIFFEKYFHLAELMTAEELGRVLKALGKVLISGDSSMSEQLAEKEKMLYSVMKSEIEEGHKKYRETCKYNNKNNNKYNKNNKNNNNYNKITSDYDFEEIERLELERLFSDDT